MVFLAEASMHGPGPDLFGFGDFLNKSALIKKTCTVEAAASSAEIYYRHAHSTKGEIIKYETSAGSGGTTEWITVGNVTLPKECSTKGKSATPDAAAPKQASATQVANSASIPNEYAGVWLVGKTSKKKCDLTKDENIFNQEWVEISSSGIRGLEWSCNSKTISTSSEGIALSADCEAEGDAYKDKFRLSLASGKLRLTNSKGQVTIFNKCPN